MLSYVTYILDLYVYMEKFVWLSLVSVPFKLRWLHHYASAHLFIARSSSNVWLFDEELFVDILRYAAMLVFPGKYC